MSNHNCCRRISKSADSPLDLAIQREQTVMHRNRFLVQ